MENQKVYGIFLATKDGQSIGWLGDSSGILFQTTSLGCANAQMQRFQEWNHNCANGEQVPTVKDFDS